jgi:hypothetical protein
MPSSFMRGRQLKATPFELWYGKKPNLSHLRVWGCQAYVQVQRDVWTKVEPHMVRCVFIGYPNGYKGWKFWDPVAKKVIISETATFDEHSFPLAKSTPSGSLSVPQQIPPSLQFQPDRPAQLPDLGGDTDELIAEPIADQEEPDRDESLPPRPACHWRCQSAS